MTFSGYRFIEIPWIEEEAEVMENDKRYYSCTGNTDTTSTTNAHKYRLFQFYDFRDARFQPQPDNNTFPQQGLCFNNKSSLYPIRNPGHPVLYIHGHWGAYEQSRSLGAHGINLTQSHIPNHLLKQRINDLLSISETYHFYDVYSLDFHKEGGALHAYRLWEQAAIIEHAVRSIVHRVEMSNHAYYFNSNLRPTTVTIVAHSIGGMVARAAFLPLTPSATVATMTSTPPYYVTNHVNTIITLATPHTSMPIAMDESVHKFYHTVNSYWKTNQRLVLNNVTIISISGGHKDEMIHPTLCDLDRAGVRGKNSFSILASNIGTYNTQSTSATKDNDIIIGMDHKAIVWCHNLLAALRDILLFLTTNNTISNNTNTLVLRQLLLGERRNNETTAFATSLAESDRIVEVSTFCLIFIK
jgi:hypothetical protein